jgi:hypothetical protein
MRARPALAATMLSMLAQRQSESLRELSSIAIVIETWKLESDDVSFGAVVATAATLIATESCILCSFDIVTSFQHHWHHVAQCSATLCAAGVATRHCCHNPDVEMSPLATFSQ